MLEAFFRDCSLFPRQGGGRRDEKNVAPRCRLASHQQRMPKAQTSRSCKEHGPGVATPQPGRGTLVNAWGSRFPKLELMAHLAFNPHAQPAGWHSGVSFSSLLWGPYSGKQLLPQSALIKLIYSDEVVS